MKGTTKRHIHTLRPIMYKIPRRLHTATSYCLIGNEIKIILPFRFQPKPL